jgi:hypothetical protein
MAQTRELTPLTSLISDAKIHLARVNKLNLNDNQKREFALKEFKDNVWPWLLDLAESMDGRVGDLEADIDDVLDHEGSVIQPEEALLIATQLGLTRTLLAFVDKLSTEGALNDLQKKEYAKIAAPLKQATDRVELAVSEAAVELDEAEGPEEPTDDENDEEDDDADDDADDTAPRAGDA